MVLAVATTAAPSRTPQYGGILGRGPSFSNDLVVRHGFAPGLGSTVTVEQDGFVETTGFEEVDGFQGYGGSSLQGFGGSSVQNFGGSSVQGFGGSSLQGFGGPSAQDFGGPSLQSFSESSVQGYGGGSSVLGSLDCPLGEIRNSDGSCGIPEVSRKIFVFAAQPSRSAPQYPSQSADPEVNIDVILVKTPNGVEGGDPIVVPPPEQRTVVYVLSKRPTAEQSVIEVPSAPEEPEVYFVNYAEGENPSLPGGIDLQSALRQAAVTSGQNIGGNQLSLSYNNNNNQFGYNNNFV